MNSRCTGIPQHLPLQVILLASRTVWTKVSFIWCVMLTVTLSRRGRYRCVWAICSWCLVLWLLRRRGTVSVFVWERKGNVSFLLTGGKKWCLSKITLMCSNVAFQCHAACNTRQFDNRVAPWRSCCSDGAARAWSSQYLTPYKLHIHPNGYKWIH